VGIPQVLTPVVIDGVRRDALSVSQVISELREINLPPFSTTLKSALQHVGQLSEHHILLLVRHH
jgi:hypothetical protein